MVRLVISIMLGLVVAIGLSGCGNAAATPSQQAADQFRSDRGGTPAAGAGNTGGASPSGGAAMAPVIGMIDRVDQSSFILKSLEGPSTTMQVSGDTKIEREVAGQRSEIQPGTAISVVGSRNGDTLQAGIVQVGGGEPLLGGGGLSGDSGPAPSGNAGSGATGPGGPGVVGGANGPVQVLPGSGGPGAGGPGAGRPFETVSGTVDKVDGDNVVLKTDSGSITVQLTADTHFQKQEPITLADLKPNTTVMVVAAQSGDAMQAKQVRVVPLNP